MIDITIPEGVTSISNRVFENCVELISVTLPSSIVAIGGKAFDYDKKLVSVISLIENPKEIAPMASAISSFTWETYNYGTLYVPVGTIEKYKATKGWKDFVHIEEGIPSGVNVPKMYPIQISYASGLISVKGVTDGTLVKVYGVDGGLCGTGITRNRQTTIPVSIKIGDMIIVKIADKPIKFVLN